MRSNPAGALGLTRTPSARSFRSARSRAARASAPVDSAAIASSHSAIRTRLSSSRQIASASSRRPAAARRLLAGEDLELERLREPVAISEHTRSGAEPPGRIGEAGGDVGAHATQQHEVSAPLGGGEPGCVVRVAVRRPTLAAGDEADSDVCSGKRPIVAAQASQFERGVRKRARLRNPVEDPVRRRRPREKQRVVGSVPALRACTARSFRVASFRLPLK